MTEPTQSGQEEQEERGKREEIDAFLVIGAFLLVFGVTVFVAIFFTPTPHGKITNLISSIVLSGIGLGGILRSQKFLRRKEKK